jgi:hypothetical protein
MTDDQLYDMAAAARYAQAYLRKMRQWKDGKIDLAVEGHEPPYMMGEDELSQEEARVARLIDEVDELLRM